MPQSKKGPLEKLSPKKRTKGGECEDSSNSSMDGSHTDYNKIHQINLGSL